MLYNYLNSNEALALNDSFKLYVTILSIAHENFKKVQNRKTKKRTAQFYASKKIRVGVAKTNPLKKRWLLDVPQSYYNCKIPYVFKNKCLVLAFALALLQHAYFENMKTNKTFLYVQNINSNDKRRQTHAGNLLLAQFNDIISKTKLPSEGPYDLLETVKILHLHYQAQFFVFSAVASKKNLILIFPPEYDDCLKPVYLYQPLNDSNHIIFIRNIKTFFQHRSRTCFSCLKSFNTMNYGHMCPKKETCFACRRPFRSELSYTNAKLNDIFCDKLVSSDQHTICSICNVTLYTKHCAKGHKKICNGKGYFGWKCNACNKFTYRYGSETSETIRNSHICGALKKCRHCLEAQDSDHLCKMKKATYPRECPKLAFLSIFFIPNNPESLTEPFLITTHVEKDLAQGLFKVKLFSEIPEIIPNCINFVKLNNIQCYPSDPWKNKKQKEDFLSNFKELQRKKSWSLTHQLLYYLLRHQNTTFICHDNNCSIMVTINLNQTCSNTFQDFLQY